MAKCTTESWKIKEIVDALSTMSHNGKKIVIPRFQRGKRWSEAQELTFIDSLKRGYPVGTLLFYRTNEMENGNPVEIYTLVDGLQRSTAISRYMKAPMKYYTRESISNEMLNQIYDVLGFTGQGRKHDKSFYPVIYGAEDEDDWGNEKVWYKANPSLGITVDIDKLKTAYNSAKENPAEENLFRQLRLNQWVKQNVRWMPMDAWDKCDFAVDGEKLFGRECYGGLDLSSSTDITAFVLVFPPTADDDKYSILPFFWIPEDTIDLRVRRDHVPYDTWLGRKQIIATEGNVIHYGYIENFIEELGTKYHIKEIAFDRWGAVQMVQNLEGMGFTVVPFGQGFQHRTSIHRICSAHHTAVACKVGARDKPFTP